MKRLVLLLLFGVTAGANGFTGDKSLLARVTVYWAQGGHGADQYTRQHKSATGTRFFPLPIRASHKAIASSRSSARTKSRNSATPSRTGSRRWVLGE